MGLNVVVSKDKIKRFIMTAYIEDYKTLDGHVKLLLMKAYACTRKYFQKSYKTFCSFTIVYVETYLFALTL